MQAYGALAKIRLDDLAEKVGGRYRLTYLISQRLRQINAGSPILVERKENEPMLSVVAREVQEGKIWIEVADAPSEDEESDFDILGLDDVDL